MKAKFKTHNYAASGSSNSKFIEVAQSTRPPDRGLDHKAPRKGSPAESRGHTGSARAGLPSVRLTASVDGTRPPGEMMSLREQGQK